MNDGQNPTEQPVPRLFQLTIQYDTLSGQVQLNAPLSNPGVCADMMKGLILALVEYQKNKSPIVRPY